jgi:hypothetical protein
MRRLTHRPPRSFAKYVLFVLTVGLVAALATIGAVGTVGAQEQTCPDLDTGKIDPPGEPTSLVITAPPGQVIVQVCVKAGSAQQGDGPEFTDFNPGVTQTTISHTSGKAISHYSVKFADVPPPTTVAPPTTAGAPPPGPQAAPRAPQAARPPAPGAAPTPGAAAAVTAQPRTTG